MVAHKHQLPMKTFQVKILGPNGYSRNIDLAEGKYSVGSDQSSDIILKHNSIAGRYATLEISNGNLELKRLADGKNYKTQYTKNEWVKCEDFYIQVPVTAENSQNVIPEDESFSVAQTQDHIPAVPSFKGRPVKAPVAKKAVAKKK